MPPGSPNDPSYAAHTNALMNACRQPPVKQPIGIPVTTLARYPDGKQLDLWMTSNDGNIYTAFFNEAAGLWHGPIQIAGAVPSGLLAGAPVAALARYPDGKQLDLWVTGNDGNVYTAFFNDAGGAWHGWFPIAGAVPNGLPAGAPVAALARYPDGKQLDLWVTGNDGNVYTAFFNEADGVWHGWFPIAGAVPSGLPAGAPVAALARYPDGKQLDLWVTGNDGNVYTAFFNDADGVWHGWFPIAGAVPSGLLAGAPVAALARYPEGNQLDLWVTGNDGNVYTAFFNDAAGVWNGWFPIAGAVPSGLPAGAPVAALARYPQGNQLDLWVTGNDGNVYTAFFNDASGVWNPWLQINGAIPSGLPAGAPIAALARYPDGKQLDLWVTGNDGNVYTAFFNEAGGVWSGWIPLWNGAGPQPPQGSITVAQNDGTPPTLSLGVGQPGGQSGAVSDGGLGQTIKLMSKTGPLNLIVTANDPQSGIQTIEVWVNRKITSCNTAGICTTSGPGLLSQPKFKSTAPQKQPGETTAASSIMAQVLDLSTEIPQGNVASGASRTVELILYAVAVNHRGGQTRTPELNVVWSEP